MATFSLRRPDGGSTLRGGDTLQLPLDQWYLYLDPGTGRGKTTGGSTVGLVDGSQGVGKVTE